MHVSLLFVVSLVVAVSCHPLLFHLEKNGALSPDLICPDHVSQCADGSTCCQLKGVEGYGCCPQPQATCCDDGIHCCPHTYSCSNSNTCSKGDLAIPATKRLPATARLDAEALSARRQHRVSVMCPDDHSECPITDTCCLMSDDRSYGCCPERNAVCCADGKHCCPYGYTCDPSTGKCEGDGSSIPMLTKRPLATHTTSTVNAPFAKEQHQIATNKPRNIIMCDDKKTQCADGNTCCKLPPGKDSKYGCCPMSNATCCSDGIHCCPSTYACNVSGEICSKGSTNVPLTKKVQALRTGPQNVVCPDKETQCSTGCTCCQLKSGDYACCPLANALCCEDDKHCCPSDYECNIAQGTCIKGDQVIAMFKKHPAIKKTKQNVFSPKAFQNNVCPDQKSECASNATCCVQKSGAYACCPLPFAVCCEDKLHCCPNDYACQNGMCVDRDSTIATFKKQPALQRKKSHALVALAKAKDEPESSLISKSQIVMCPDQASICPDGYTCCRNVSGGYSCCPYDNAVCCDDKKHCCPEDYTCNLSSGSCVNGNSILPLSEKISATCQAPQNIMCPDQTQCYSNNTCCMLENGSYSCCPATNAVCCADRVHCCPSGTTCDLIGRKCRETKLFTKLLATNKTPQNIICPDKQSECANNATCCQLKTGEYGCCPTTNAVCCGGGVYCCPSGTICDVPGQKCIVSDSTIPLLKLFEKPSAAAASRRVQTPQNVYCPDGDYCSNSETCCQLAWGGYGCCSYSNAVCCSDHKSCCPSWTTCDPYTDKCSYADSSIPPLKKQPLRTATRTGTLHSSTIVCPNGQDECSDNSTCCPLSSGQYGCCPVRNAFCCPDNVHCCPQGYACDSDTGTCSKESSIIPILKHIDLQQTTVKKLRSVICPDKRSECPSGSTCCKRLSGGYGCCPLPTADCCSDGEHCCPSDYKCDTAAGTCTKGDQVIAIFRKQPATKKAKLSVKAPQNVICPDKESQCSDGSTCCLLKSGDYACCPLANALCCEDKVHCCPGDYKCNTAEGTCTKGDQVIAMFKKQPAIKEAKQNVLSLIAPQNVICPDGKSECADGSTCCQLMSGVYGCCPQANAVCCKDDKHCCPSGYECNAANLTCIKGEHVIAMFKKQPTIKSNQITVKNLKNVECPDGRNECPDQNTCCKLASGDWGCCPLLNAVCCSDGEHCCPSGYFCGSDICMKGKDSIIRALLTELLPPRSSTPPSSISEPQNLVPCHQNRRYYCQPNQKCCQSTTVGVYECCPIASLEAVCCIGQNACCPQGYTCTRESKNCIPKNVASHYPFLKPKWLAYTTTKQHGVMKSALVPPTVKQSTIEISSSKLTSRVSQNVVCPDQRSVCKANYTCCVDTSGEYECCPVQNAICCSDKKHCCPVNYTCDIKAQTCTKGDRIIASFKKQPPIIKLKAPQNVICPDQESECSNNSTCCLLKSGAYGCCPIPKAQCCKDRKHCCPEGYACMPGKGTCAKGDQVVAMVKKQPAIKSPQNVICPDQKSECGSNSTCCLLASGEYGCCPVPNALCCEDEVHCCPEGYACNAGRGTCVKGDQVMAMIRKQPAIVKNIAPQTGVVPCPDQSTCPDKSTCCKLKSGRFGCCPQVNGVCCADGEHCCSAGFGVCCADGEHCCPTGFGVCCADGEHCCPTGFACDLNKGICIKGDTIIAPFLAKLAVATIEGPEGVIKCPDNSFCPDTSTCCQLESGSYGCCLQVHATCCSDKEHCCPQSYTCQYTSKTCTKGNTIVPMLKKLPSFSSAQDAIIQKKEPLVYEPQNVICPDRRSQCPTDNTCCLTAGVYRCCPGTNAVCCGDRIHCCPEGFTCHIPTKTCTKGDTVVPMLKKLQSIRSLKKVIKVPEPKTEDSRTNSPLNVVCPDRRSQCPNSNTCCRSGDVYNCCPTPNAVCCSDKHCCPKGYICDIKRGMCDNEMRGVAIPLMEAAMSAATKDDVIEMTRDVL